MSHENNSCSAAVMADCDILPDAKQGERILQIDLSDAFGDAHSNCHYGDLHHAPPILASVPPDSVRPTFIVGPTISIQNCVFLK